MKRKVWIGCVLVAFIIVGRERKPLSTQGEPETPLARKVDVAKERVERVPPPPPEVKIKLRKDGKENYSWELSGSDVDQILKVDKKLKKQLGGDQKEAPSAK